MKSCRPIVLLLSAVWLLTLAACGPTAFRTRLAGADSLLCQHPDSALHVLRGWEAEAGRACKSDRMYWRLLLADAENKCYVDQTSDSAMKAVADYYDSHGTANEQVRAHYLLGCAYRDMSDAPQALQCYQDAVDCADTTSKDCDYRLMMCVYAQMSSLFHAQNLPTDELATRKIVQHYARLSADTLEYLRSYELMVKPYALLKDTAMMLKTLEEARSLYARYGYYHMIGSCYGSIISIEVKRNHLSKAKELINKFERETKVFDADGNIEKGREIFYYTKGEFFRKSHQLDSADFYMRRLLPYHYKMEAYYGLLNIYRDRNTADSIAKYACLYSDAVDSINVHQQTTAIHQMSQLYNYQVIQRQAFEQIQKANTQKLFFVILGFTLFVILLLVVFSYVEFRKKQKQKFLELVQEYETQLLGFNKISAELERLKNNEKDIIGAGGNTCV